MKPETELRIFGYIDPEPPIPGSWKAEVVKLIDQAEFVGEKVLEEYILQFVTAYMNMRLSRERLFIDARMAAVSVLSLALAAGNGGYVSEFGTVTYSRLVSLATDNKTDYCQVNGHTRHMQLDRCIFCCKPMEAKK